MMRSEGVKIVMKNVKEFGAVGDGKTNDTKAIQKAIDSGGCVYIPDGEYITGTLYLKSNGGLYLAPGAKITASHNREDYNSADYCPQNRIFKSEFMAGTHLITAVEQENIFIAGFGTVYGDSHYWVNEKKTIAGFWDHPAAEANCPGQMIFFAECKNVRVENVNLQYAPFWHLFFHGCTDVIIRGLNIKGERRQWVNDGIDLDCCSNVAISDCIIDTGDDTITIRTCGSGLVEKEAVCENITVSNCTLTSYLDYGIRLGVGEGIIRDCLFDNIIIKDSLLGTGATCRFSAAGNGTAIENISFSNMIINARCAIDLQISAFQSHPALPNDAYIKKIRFNNVDINSNRCCYILGFKEKYCTDIEFNNSSLTLTPEPEDKRSVHGRWDVDKDDCAFYVLKSKNVKFNNFSIRKNNCAEYDILTEDSENVTGI